MGKNRRTGNKSHSSVTLSITKLTWNCLGSNPDFGDERPSTNRLNHGTEISEKYEGNIYKICPYFIVNILPLHTKT